MPAGTRDARAEEHRGMFPGRGSGRRTIAVAFLEKYLDVAADTLDSEVKRAHGFKRRYQNKQRYHRCDRIWQPGQHGYEHDGPGGDPGKEDIRSGSALLRIVARSAVFVCGQAVHRVFSTPFCGLLP